MSFETSKRYLVVIPARGGSKRLPGKNLMEIGGCSLIGRAIASVMGLAAVRNICISTDDRAIADEAMRHGPYVHFMRPEYLATDSAKTVDVVMHAIQWFADKDECFDAVILLQPTSPLRTRQHVTEAIRLYEERQADAVVSVCKLEHPIEWCAELGADGSMATFGTNLNTQKRSQELVPKYRLNGAIYIYDIQRLMQEKGFFYNARTYAYEMDLPSSTDVDTYDDFLLATFWENLTSGNTK